LPLPVLAHATQSWPIQRRKRFKKKEKKKEKEFSHTDHQPNL
jgi:hypothetical protein